MLNQAIAQKKKKKDWGGQMNMTIQAVSEAQEQIVETKTVDERGSILHCYKCDLLVTFGRKSSTVCKRTMA